MPQDKETQIIDKVDIEIEKVPQSELNEREEGVPFYKVPLEYDEEQTKRLSDEIFKGFERLKEERTSEKKEEEWDALEAQYDGEMEDDADLEFTLNVPVTKGKVDSAERLSLKAFLESDPKFTITPRPQTSKQDKWDVIVQRQSDYLDYKLDEEIDLETPLRPTLHDSFLLDVGIVKVPYVFMRKPRKREEYFSGKVKTDERGVESQPGVEAFSKQYPEALEPGNEGHWAYKDLMEKKDVTFKAEFNETVYDDPRPMYVNIRDLFVSKDCEGYEGLCEQKLIIERQRNWTWWELKAAEKRGEFENVDKVKVRVVEEGDGEQKTDDDDFRHRDYTVLECVYNFNEVKDSEDPDDETKIICWFEVGSKAFLGAILYPYDNVDSVYVPFYVKKKKQGFYKGGMGADLTDSNIAQNAFLNFMLTESWQQLMTTPIIRDGSPIADQFLNKRWKPGIPLIVSRSGLERKNELDFLERPQRAVASQVIPMLLYLAKLDDDRTGISAGLSGKESPTDPNAPAAKTAMLLRQSGINIGDYIACLLPSFNKIAEIILQLTYQMSHDGKPFRNNKIAQKVVGGDPFETISRAEMIAKTNIQSRASSFDFDKINEKRENLALYQAMRGDPILTQNPEGVYTLAKTLVKSWSPMWKNKIDMLLPTPEQFQANQFKVAFQALGLYMQQLKKTAEVTGVEAKPDFEEFLGFATTMMQQAVTPAEEKK